MTDTIIDEQTPSLTDTPLADIVIELLEICEQLLQDADRDVHAEEVDRILLDRGITGGPSWLIDTLGFTASHLQHQRHVEANRR